MKNYFALGFVSLGIFPLLLSLPPDEKISFGYFHLTRPALFPLQQARLDSLKTEKAYLAALRAADEKTFQNEFEAEFFLLLGKRQTQEYDSLATLEARQAYIENYWKAVNPNPLLPENDWLLDVLKRRAYARENFPAPAPPYFDDRGKYYLKYGKPSFRYWEAGSPDNIFPNESWSYENVARNFLVNFVKDGPTFRETDNPLAIFVNGKFRHPALNPERWAAIAVQRAAVSPVFGRAYAQIQALKAARLHAAAFPNSRTALGIEYQQPQSILFAIYQQAETEIIKARNERPAAAHDEIQAINKLKFAHDLAQFRGAGGTTRLEISLLAPLEKNLLKKLSRDSGDTLRLEYGGLLRDQVFAVVAEERLKHEFFTKFAAAAKLPNAAGSLTMTARPQKSELTLQIKNTRQDQIGFVRQEIDIRDFTGRALMLSDIQLLTEVTNQNQKLALPVSAKQNAQVAPYPFEKIRSSIPLLCYFEIYNLKTAGVAEQYEIVYKVISEKGGSKDVAVSVSSTRAVSDDTAQELIGIDLRKVPEGRHRLEITVTSATDDRIKASATKEIVIDE